MYTESSSPFRVKSLEGNYYYSVFVDERSGRYLAIPYARKSEFSLVFLQFVAKIARFPKILLCDSASEILSATMTSTFAPHELSRHVVPKGEHFANAPAERAIALMDNMVKTLLAAQDLPRNTRDILVEHSTLIHAVIRLCPTNKKVQLKVTVYEAETGMIPSKTDHSEEKFGESRLFLGANLILRPASGCFGQIEMESCMLRGLSCGTLVLQALICVFFFHGRVLMNQNVPQARFSHDKIRRVGRCICINLDE